MSDLYNVSSSSHIRAKDTSAKIMLYVVLALLPAAIFGVWNFGLNALILILVCVAACVASEWVFEKLIHKKSTINDFSAVVTGLLLALNLPHTLPIWQAVLGSVFAIVIVKMLFGGLGQNFMNPALGARCFLLVSFAGTMTSFTYDGVTGATPLALLKNGESVDTMKMLLGTTAGTIGETSVIAILIGAVFLILMGVIDLKIPASYLVSFIIFILLFGGHGFDMEYVTAHLCGGGLMLGAFFMATDYVTSPITPMGKIVYGILLGILTGLFRIFGANAEGVSFAIILSNLLVPIIEKFTIPRAFGQKKEVKQHE
ncbi:MAG: RnfABCDGE type electron transport complex subunit D [Lachnospiraceae bacterium]|nr:RnfABCDGE type electron transport complex subunit D [Lachnospiraceae bacterium]